MFRCQKCSQNKRKSNILNTPPNHSEFFLQVEEQMFPGPHYSILLSLQLVLLYKYSPYHGVAAAEALGDSHDYVEHLELYLPVDYYNYYCYKMQYFHLV